MKKTQLKIIPWDQNTYRTLCSIYIASFSQCQMVKKLLFLFSSLTLAFTSPLLKWLSRGFLCGNKNHFVFTSFLWENQANYLRDGLHARPLAYFYTELLEKKSYPKSETKKIHFKFFGLLDSKELKRQFPFENRNKVPHLVFLNVNFEKKTTLFEMIMQVSIFFWPDSTCEEGKSSGGTTM